MSRPPLKKALGQHHLVDGRLCHPLLSFLRLSPAGPARDRTRVLEIGPGGGVLTAELVRADARVWAWELDPGWALALRSLAVERGWLPGRGGSARPDGGRLDGLVVGDALEIPWDRLPAPTVVTGNLPYGIATALVARVLRHPRRVPRCGFLVQKEVADRLAAGPGDADYGALSVLTAARAQVRVLGRVKAGSFRPPPKVDGAFVGLVARRPPLPPDGPGGMEGFEATVRRAFAQRRKTLRNSLGAGWGKDTAERVLDAAGIPARARAEELSLVDFLRLHAARLEDFENAKC